MPLTAVVQRALMTTQAGVITMPVHIMSLIFQVASGVGGEAGGINGNQEKHTGGHAHRQAGNSRIQPKIYRQRAHYGQTQPCQGDALGHGIVACHHQVDDQKQDQRTHAGGPGQEEIRQDAAEPLAGAQIGDHCRQRRSGTADQDGGPLDLSAYLLPIHHVHAQYRAA